jgi:UDP-4-amino-4-deoxy-L-arabinose formyltransferase/UDP-glucuronic acid dehydrogenase (UDP-4-keto-hexauronic acid decarboxylating)
MIIFYQKWEEKMWENINSKAVYTSMSIYMLNATFSGMQLVKQVSKLVSVEGLIGLSNRRFGDFVSGGYYCKDDCRALGIEFIEVDDYVLNGDDDKNKLLNLKIDILFVVGWQRLVPKWLIEHCGEVIGFHGSPWGINSGRGRSPQNWSLILGEKKFSLSMFYITPSIDSGNVIDTREFCYTELDDIKTSQYKVNLLSAEMIVSYVDSNCQISTTVQNDSDARYLPQRLPEDGGIDWNSPVTDIYNIIRALTHPFPGAYTYYSGHKMIIWKARPFSIKLKKIFNNGEIVEIFMNNDLLIGAIDGLILVEEYDLTNGTSQLKIGGTCTSVSARMQLENIVIRHKAKYPEMLIQERLLELIKI